MDGILSRGLEIGLNGCSLKTEENCAVAAQVPLEKLHLETDAPYCDIRQTHFSHQFVKTKFDTSKKYKPEAMYKAHITISNADQDLTVITHGCALSMVLKQKSKLR